jgi:hypothetical protein
MNPEEAMIDEGRLRAAAAAVDNLSFVGRWCDGYRRAWICGVLGSTTQVTRFGSSEPDWIHGASFVAEALTR